MKRILKVFFAFFTLVVLMNSCLPEEDLFDSNLLIGKWSRNYLDGAITKTEFYRYDANGNGVTWVPAEDVSESEGQGFTWTLVSSTLTHIHIMEKGGTGIPKIYEVIELTSAKLTYRDDFNKTYSFIKVN
jgi:hypothetical protein